LKSTSCFLSTIQPICRFLSDHDCGRIGVGPNHIGHH
jgi:hypothetical protein